MEKLVSEFDWYSSRTPNTKCRVYVREQRGVKKIHIESYAEGMLTGKGVTFRPEELPHILNALKQAQEVLERS